MELHKAMDHMAASRVDRAMVKEMAVALMVVDRVMVAMGSRPQLQLRVIPSHQHREGMARPSRATRAMDSRAPTPPLGMQRNLRQHHHMVSKVPMDNLKEVDMEDGMTVTVRVVARAGDMEETTEAQTGLRAIEAVGVAAMTAVVTTAAVTSAGEEEEEDMTGVDEVVAALLLVLGKSQSATARQVLITPYQVHVPYAVHDNHHPIPHPYRLLTHPHPAPQPPTFYNRMYP